MPERTSRPGRFEGKVALVSGSSRGIGLGVAKQLGHEGARVVLNARRAELEAAYRELRAAGADAVAIAGNIADESTTDAMARAASERWGRVDLVVSNVGISPYWGPLAGIDRERFVKTMTVNTWPVVALVQAALANGLAEGGGGAVVAVSTVGVHATSWRTATYTASKAALNALCASLARELGPSGVRVNVVCPGMVPTHLNAVFTGGGRGAVHDSLVPLRRPGTPEDLAGAICFLLSDDARWITGAVLDVDGGLQHVGAADPELVGLLAEADGRSGG